MIAGGRLYPILSPLVDGEVYPLFAPEPPEGQARKTPYIIWQVISSQPENTYDGITGHEWVRVQIDVYDQGYDACLQLGSDVIGVINLAVQPSTYDGSQSMYDHDANLFRQSIDFEFWQTTEASQVALDIAGVVTTATPEHFVLLEELVNKNLPENMSPKII